MTLIGKRIKHKTLGVGVVIAQENGILTIEFPTKISKFQYNEQMFSKFLTAEEVEVQAAILREFAEMKEAEKQKALQAALAKQKEE